MDSRLLVLLLCLGSIHAKLVRLSCAQVRALVDAHNAARLRVARGSVPGQPAAAHMNALIWDEELAAKAAKWASRNQFQHNPDRTLGSKRFKTGENLYIYGTTNQTYEFKPTMATTDWFDEYKDFIYKKMSYADFGSSKAIGHYTQMVWSNTLYFGCAMSIFPQGRFKQHLVVCNYGPAGNIIDQYPYAKGKGVRQLECGADDCSRVYGSC